MTTPKASQTTRPTTARSEIAIATLVAVLLGTLSSPAVAFNDS